MFITDDIAYRVNCIFTYVHLTKQASHSHESHKEGVFA